MACRPSVVLLLLVLALPACDRQKAPVSKAGEPQVAATVVTIRTVTQPDNRSWSHSMFIANGVVRSGDEVDVWHLYEPDRGIVTTVDEIAGTHRRYTEQDLVAARKRLTGGRVNSAITEASLTPGSGAVVTLGIQTRESVITSGKYRRELWFGVHPQIPPKLHSLMYATRLAESPAAGVTPAVDEAIRKLNGYPLVDRSELPYGDRKMTVERTVTRVDQKQVPRSWFELPKKSRDVTPAPPSKKR